MTNIIDFYQFLLLVFAIIISNFYCVINNELNCIDDVKIWRVDERQPFFHIDSILNDEDLCEYSLVCWFSLNTDQHFFQRNSTLFVENGKWTIDFGSPFNKRLIIFDFDKKIQPERIVEFDFRSENSREIVRRKIATFYFNHDDYECVAGLKIDSFYFYEKMPLDGVLFLSDKRGIIGSFFTSTDLNSNKYMIAEVGDILENKIDYSDYRRVDLK